MEKYPALFHGTVHSIVEFDVSFSNTDETYGYGVYFTTDYKRAQQYSGRWAEDTEDVLLYNETHQLNLSDEVREKIVGTDFTSRSDRKELQEYLERNVKTIYRAKIFKTIADHMTPRVYEAELSDKANIVFYSDPLKQTKTLLASLQAIVKTMKPDDNQKPAAKAFVDSFHKEPFSIGDIVNYMGNRLPRVSEALMKEGIDGHYLQDTRTEKVFVVYNTKLLKLKQVRLAIKG